ncbi:MAG: hypothetical protein PHT95_05575, partial [Candidatus Omnitrophica bacterium]|nr:hypothetical protein [Candidatus Omnitrophota bacterium]
EASRRKERMEDGIREKQIEFSNIASKKALVGEKVDSINEEMVLLDAEMQEEEALIKNACEETEKLNSEIRSVEAESVKVNEEIHESQSAITELTTYREETLYLIMDVKAELYGLRKEEENLTENLSREKETFIRVKQEVDERRSRIAESADRIRTLEAEIGDLAARNKELKSELAVMEQGIGSRKARKEHLSELIAVEEKKLGTTQNELEEARNKARDMDISGKELEYRKNSILERIRETYKMDLAELSLTLDENTDWEEVDRKISELKIQLENMGEVSLGAVEELRELEERFQFLTKQRDDLVNAKDSLMDAIQKINRTTRTMFMESFEAIRKEFNTYFRMLFNGGKADLILQDETNVLECGIDIEVRPPGKKLHNIMQLSGGEKAMTATALIFAIFKVNPSPFCILDEIDAPLDESNIVRFCRVLQEFLKLSQFIVVTHNRMTIQLADVLYGITMQEKGVSQVVSVKFGSEKEKEITAAENVAAAA